MERDPELERLRGKIIDAIGLTEGEVSTLDGGSEHPHHCRCITCLNWWRMCGPEDEDPDAPGAWGPFTRAEIEAANG